MSDDTARPDPAEAAAYGARIARLADVLAEMENRGGNDWTFDDQARYVDEHLPAAALSAPVEAGATEPAGEWREPEGGPDDGHSWRIEVTSRGSYGVTGNPEHHDADYFDGPLRTSVRAWSLSAALKAVAKLPLFEWIVDYTELSEGAPDGPGCSRACSEMHTFTPPCELAQAVAGTAAAEPAPAVAVPAIHLEMWAATLHEVADAKGVPLSAGDQLRLTAEAIQFWASRVEAAAPAEPTGDTERISVPRDLLDSMIDPDPCWFDHHGGCQAHGYLSLEPGEVCPQADLKSLLSGSVPSQPAPTDTEEQP